MLPKSCLKLVAVPFALILAGCSLQQPSGGVQTTRPTPTAVAQRPNVSASPGKDLQLETFKLPTPSPTPQPTPHSTPPETPCQYDSVKSPNCTCPLIPFTTIPEWQCSSANTCGYFEACNKCGNNPVCLVQPPAGFINCAAPNQAWVRQQLADGLQHCIGKPVIYLYPTKDTTVDVSLTIPGSITISDPLYSQEGWQHILAHPTGLFDYQGRTYRELYYETAVKTVKPPTNGIVLRTDELASTLPLLTTQLGLLPDEQQEFVSYWLPKLQALNSPYVLFSVLDGVEKERIDHVAITPKPDTFIAFLAYFKPLAHPIEVLPLVLPQTPPQRNGFTVVEWGGTIDY